MTSDQLKQIEESLQECKPRPEDFDWGPCFEFAEKRRKEALKILRHAIKECRSEIKGEKKNETNI